MSNAIRGGSGMKKYNIGLLVVVSLFCAWGKVEAG